MRPRAACVRAGVSPDDGGDTAGLERAYNRSVGTRKTFLGRTDLLAAGGAGTLPAAPLASQAAVASFGFKTTGFAFSAISARSSARSAAASA
jgi:hypothetical protein